MAGDTQLLTVALKTLVLNFSNGNSRRTAGRDCCSFCGKGHPAGTESTRTCHCQGLSVITAFFLFFLLNISCWHVELFAFTATSLAQVHILNPPDFLDLFPTGCSVPRLLLPHPLRPPYAQGAKGVKNIQNLPIWSK